MIYYYMIKKWIKNLQYNRVGINIIVKYILSHIKLGYFEFILYKKKLFSYLFLLTFKKKYSHSLKYQQRL